jgi:hypothetical protein
VGPAWQPLSERVSGLGSRWAGYWALLVDFDPLAGFLYYFMIPFLFIFLFSISSFQFDFQFCFAGILNLGII